MENFMFQNPILRGYRPDPSICFVNGDYYLVNSTFEYFPGVPVFHSRDLINWKQINACLTRETQLSLHECRISGGIYAPTIRWHNGRFYMITTNVTSGGNFIVSTDDILGSWSEPIWIDHIGIDPSLFFNDDGKTYYCGTGLDGKGKQGIVLFEIDIETGAILSDKQFISYGFTEKYPEGPHIYKINEWYYLMLAEGGTEYGHMETIFRSRSIQGPYESCPNNPILSNRNEMNNEIQCCGHADITADANGNWWMVCLGIRKLSNGVMLHNLGRETFLAPVTWTPEGWPQVGRDGVIRETMEGPLPQGETVWQPCGFEDDFTQPQLAPAWTFLRNPRLENYTLANGVLHIKGCQETLNDFHPSFAGVRQTEFHMNAQVAVSAELETESARAGITVYYSKENHYDFYIERKNGKLWAVLSRRIMDLEAVTGKVCLVDTPEGVTLQVETSRKEYVFRVLGSEGYVTVGTGCAAGVCTEGTMTMTFTGTFIGLFATETDAQFRAFRLTESQRENIAIDLVLSEWDSLG